MAQALADNALPPSALSVEVTETVALDDSVLPVLTRLHALGVRVAMDDFGIGYSSLSYLKRLPISVLKVDRSFVRDVVNDRFDEAIISSIVAIAHGLGFRVIAEGIEDDSQFRRIAALGCDEAQGFYIGRPQTLQPSSVTCAVRAPAARGASENARSPVLDRDVAPGGRQRGETNVAPARPTNVCSTSCARRGILTCHPT